MRLQKKMVLKRMVGASLLEVLVAILILSLAALANAGLQIAGIRANSSAKYRSIAAAHINDMADRMRSNRAGLSYFNLVKGIPSSDPNSGCSALATPCNAAQMAQHDFYEWTTALSKALPEGQAAICLDTQSAPANAATDTYASPTCSGTGTTYSIKVWWDDSRGEKIAQIFTTNFQP
ncbi:type IV pilus modification protein PilV [Undibacterium sp. Ji49W]|uniref:type IV pilus modification protein PilV n=1 Tax=Undibacterium sp. Ji49W TaxID=3413040 RepID=UPI003BF30188